MQYTALPQAHPRPNLTASAAGWLKAFICCFLCCRDGLRLVRALPPTPPARVRSPSTVLHFGGRSPAARPQLGRLCRYLWRSRVSEASLEERPVHRAVGARSHPNPTGRINNAPCSWAAGPSAGPAIGSRSRARRRFRKRDGELLDVDLAKARRAAEASLSHLFKAGAYDPDCLEERFPDLGGEKPAAWTGS
jgi:hypothetical protein